MIKKFREKYFKGNNKIRIFIISSKTGNIVTECTANGGYSITPNGYKIEDLFVEGNIHIFTISMIETGPHT